MTSVYQILYLDRNRYINSIVFSTTVSFNYMVIWIHVRLHSAFTDSFTYSAVNISDISQVKLMKCTFVVALIACSTDLVLLVSYLDNTNV